VALLVLCAAGEARGQVATLGKQDRPKAQGKIALLNPLHFSSVPLSSPKDEPGAVALEPPTFGRRLRNIGLRRFREYLHSVLPQELQIDEQMREEFNQLDHGSRVNLAFLRWQKRVYAEREGLDVEAMSARGERTPMLPGINYSWPELYDSAEFKKLKVRIGELTRLYLKRTGYKNEDLPKKFNEFVWVEVFEKGDALRPAARTDGAYLLGRYFASAKKGAVKLNFEDTRGINPPYGKTYSHLVYEGNVVLFPTWSSHFITPNMFNYSVVSYCFLVYPEGGNTLHWSDDRTSSITVNLPFQAKAPQQQQQQAAPPKGSPRR